MAIVNNCKAKTVEAKVATKQTGKGSTLVYLVDPTYGTPLAGGELMRIGNKTGNVYLEKRVSSKFGFALDAYGRLQITSTLGKAKRC
jgi:hypothetical protein